MAQDTRIFGMIETNTAGISRLIIQASRFVPGINKILDSQLPADLSKLPRSFDKSVEIKFDDWAFSPIIVPDQGIVKPRFTAKKKETKKK